MSKGGRIAGSTLSFIVGILFGILVLVIGVASAAFFIASGVTVYKAQQIAGVDIIEPDSEWGSQTLWNFGKSIYKDYHNLGNLTIEDLQKYGVKIPDEVEGVDLTALYKTPFKDMTKDMTGSLQKVLDGITLQWVADKTGLDITKLPILKEQADEPVIKAINNLMGSIDANKMTLRTLSDNFGVTLGDTDLFKSLQDAPLANFGNIINGLPLKTIIGSDLDEFVQTDTAITLYVSVAEENRYHKIAKGHEKDSFGGDTYMYDFNNDTKTLIYREFRYIKQEDGTYKVSYNPWADDFDSSTDTNDYYYSTKYVVYNGSNAGSTDNIYLKPVENYTILKGTEYVFIDGEYLKLTSIYTKTSTDFIACTPTSATYTFNSLTTYYYEAADDKAAEVYGPDEAVFTKDTRLTNAGTGYIRVHKGTTEPLPQAIGNLSVSGINDMNSVINNIKLGDVISVDSSTTRILQTLENTKISGLSEAVDNLYLDEVIDIVYDTYSVDTAGIYVQLPNGRYTLFNPANPDHATLTRYTKTTVGGKVDVGGEMKDVSSQALQALGKSIVKNISDDFKTLAIGDVMDIDTNQYVTISGEDAKLDSTGKTFYRYNDGVYYSLTQDEVDALADDATVYYISVAGTGNAIMRKLAYVAVDAMSGKISSVIDDTYLGEVIDIVYDEYVENPDGIYVKDGKRYVLFNPAVHDTLMIRYNKVPVVDSSSQALQALGNTNIGQISSAFTTLTIGDVMDVTPNKYTGILVAVAKTDSTNTYYKYDDGVYLSIDDWTGFNDGDTVYYVSANGTGNAILRKLAYVKIDDMASKLTPIVDDTLLSEIIDIYPNDIVTEDSTASNYLVEHNANYTIKDTSGNDVYYAFVLDNKGSYYLDTQMYELATTEQLGNATPKYYRYVQVPVAELQNLSAKFWGGIDVPGSKETIGNYFYYSKTQGKYLNSYMFSLYVLIKSADASNAPNSAFANTNPGLANVFYKKEACNSTDTGAIAYNTYDGQNLWVQSRLSTSTFEAYDPTNPNMAERDIYFFYEATLVGSNYEGYYIASSEVRELAKTDTTIHVYTADFTLLDPYTDVSADYRVNPATYDGKALYVKVSGKDGCYYCNVSDTTGDVPKYNKVYCETIMVRSGDVDTPVIGYLAKEAQIKWHDGSGDHYIDGVDPSKKYAYAQQKSSKVLCAFDKNKVRVGKLGDALKTFTLGDVVSVEPGSILDDATLLNAKLDEISSTLSSKLSNLTIKEVLVWANISTMKPEVKAAIQDLALSDMFGSFTLDQTSWEIKMDTLKLFNPQSYEY